jgi:hypothetical protein
MDSESEKFVDQLLNASLDRYASIEPCAGLEGRTLSSVAARHRTAQQRNWALGFALSAFAVVAMIVAVRQQRHATVPAQLPMHAAATQPEGAATLAPFAPERLRARRVRITKAAAQRPQQFPTPSPLSEQEKLLLLYVKETPKSVLAAPATAAEKDLEIPALNIAALEIKDLPGSNDQQ